MSLISKLFGRDAAEHADTPGAVTPADAGGVPRVTLYSTSWCGSCAMAKRYFNDRGVGYDEIDIEEAPEAAERVMRWAGGFKTVPTMLIGETIVVDWDRKAVAAALAREGIL